MWLEIYLLIQHVDNIVSPLTLAVYFYSLIVVIIKLFHCLTPKLSPFDIIQHWYSLMLHILKLFLLTHFASNVREESKRTTRILNRIESDLWTTEAYMFIENMKQLEVYLTGWRIFRIDRTIVISVSFIIIITVALQPRSGPGLLNGSPPIVPVHSCGFPVMDSQLIRVLVHVIPPSKPRAPFSSYSCRRR